MACKCTEKCKAVGFYKELTGEKEIVEDAPESLIISGKESDVYEVERLVDKRIKKGITMYLVLWKGYSKEEASWLPAKDITATAIRLYNEPEPCHRVLTDDISALRSALQSSLKSGILRRRKITISFHRHAFNYLFKEKGRPVPYKPGKLYDRFDFPSQYFEESFFNFYNKFGEGCCVVFPVYMYSYVAFDQQSFHSNKKSRKRSFTETLALTVVKSFVV